MRQNAQQLLDTSYLKIDKGYMWLHWLRSLRKQMTENLLFGLVLIISSFEESKKAIESQTGEIKRLAMMHGSLDQSCMILFCPTTHLNRDTALIKSSF